MRKILRSVSWLCFFFLLYGSLQAQERDYSGTIVSAENGNPLSGASVRIKGASTGVQTNEQGRFTIRARSGQTLVISYVGFLEKEVTLDGTGSLSVSLSPAEGMLETVTVAMDQKRKPRELGYSTQTVGGAEIQQTQRENLLNGLQGRVAGLTINPTSGVAGASSSIVLRGFNSLSLSNEPLFVIDGVIMDNSTVNETSGGGQGVGLASDRPNRNNDYTNRIADLNPNDIESVTILKGPEATALYGSQASSGAVLITTRKAKSNRFQLQYDNSFRAQKITRFPETFEGYSNGTNGIAQNVFRYFGPAYPEGTTIFDNKRVFFKKGLAHTHNLGMDFGVKNSVFRVSGSYFNQSGVVPNNNFERLTARISNTTKIGKFLEIIPSLTYTHSENQKVLRSAGGYLLSLLVWPNDRSVLAFEDQVGNKLPLFSANPNADYDNPFFNVAANNSADVNDRYAASLGVNINPFEWLSVNGRFGYDTYEMDGYTRYHPQSFYLTQALRGQQDNFYRRYYGYNHTITATARKKVGDFSLRLMGGTMWQDYETQMFAVVGTGLIDSIVGGIMYKNGQIVNGLNFNQIVGAPTDSNSTTPNTRIRLLQNNKGKFNQEIIRQMAYFGEFAIGFRDYVYLNYTHRFESASTLPEKNRNYNYPGASLSIIASDIFPSIKNVFNYLKFRTSLAQTARLNPPYSTQSVLVNNLASGGGWSYGFFNNNPDLEPEKQSTYEIGAEMKFFNSKVGVDATYYNTLNKGQIVYAFRLSYATGFVLNTQNAGSTRNQGVEVSIDATPVSNSDFSWNIRFNFNKMWNEVVELPANIAEYYLADTWLYLNARGGLVKGGPTTSITANSYVRNDRGDILINPANGFPVTTGSVFKVAGDRNPDFTLGTINSFRYRDWRLSFLWDLKIGGDVYNGMDMFLTRAGKSIRTADRLEPRIIEGVLNDGLQNSANPTPNNIAIIPQYNDAFYTNIPDEEFIEKDVNWLRLRDISISYTLPQSAFRYVRGLKSLGFFATANDLILITNYSGVDPAVNGNTAGSRGVGAWGFDYGTLPTPVSLNVGIRAGF